MKEEKIIGFALVSNKIDYHYILKNYEAQEFNYFLDKKFIKKIFKVENFKNKILKEEQKKKEEELKNLYEDEKTLVSKICL